MSIPSTATPTVTRSVRYLLDDATEDPLANELTVWMSDSSRFRTFVDLHRDKVRKKLRGASDAESRRDVRTELHVARLLLTDRRLALSFEAYGSGKAGPDFTATVGSVRFNLEVTRLRGDPGSAGFGALLAKLRQLPPSVPNGVVLAIEGPDAAAYDIAAAVEMLRARADANDDALFLTRGFQGTRGFRDRFARLGAAFVFAESAAGESRATAWVNPSARIAFPLRARRACLTAFEGAA